MTPDPHGFEPARVFIGYDPREEVAVNVLSASFQAHASIPIQIAQVRLDQLKGVYTREPDPKQSTAFSFSRFLVPWLAGYRGWALFIDADMLCLGDIAELWALRDERMAVQVVKHHHDCAPGLKFQGMPQTPYGRKNWSSVMLFNCGRCRALTPEFVNSATGLELHQFRWLPDAEIGELPRMERAGGGAGAAARAEGAALHPGRSLVRRLPHHARIRALAAGPRGHEPAPAGGEAPQPSSPFTWLIIPSGSRPWWGNCSQSPPQPSLWVPRWP